MNLKIQHQGVNMINKIFKIFFFIFQTSILFSSGLLTPKEFLGYELGDKFSFHHDAVGYFQHVSSEVSHIDLVQYGKTYEGRPLIASIITHPNNKQSIEDIRKNHLASSGLIEGNAKKSEYAIVWLSYSVHGNEASSMEAAIKTLYSFADVKNEKQIKWLEKIVLIIDPCINPDGRDRYANYYRMTGNTIPDIDFYTRSHKEPWPGGRTNHYYHDLNRDWCWQTQKETQERIKLYKKWMPHVHVDYHEQYYDEPYYFAPAVEPYHELITSWQREFQKIIGKNNANYFDKSQLLYFRNEEFDLLYPGFGDTYPIFNGALGMTYEKGGIGAGVAIKTEAKDTLTLKERINHHYLTSIATIEATYENVNRVLEEFKVFFTSPFLNKKNKYKTFVISEANHPNKIQDLISLLKLNKIEFGFLSSGKSKSVKDAYEYITGEKKTIKVSNKDICIPVNQKLGILASVLFEPKTFLSDTLTYDITAWSLPYIYGLDAYAIESNLKLELKDTLLFSSNEFKVDKNSYGYLSKWGTINDLKFLAEILNYRVTVRVAEKHFTHEGINFKPGSLFISPRGNEHLGSKLHKIIQNAATTHSSEIVSIKTGSSSKGIDLGSSNFNVITKPKIGIFSGDGISSGNFGEIWHFFEQQIQFPISVINSSDFKSIPFDKLDVLILPNGDYSFLKTTVPSSAQIKKETGASLLIKSSPPKELLEWVNRGGRLIIIGSAMKKFVDQKGFGLTAYESETAKKEAKKYLEKEKLKERDKKYGNRKRDQLKNSVYGSIVKVDLDNSHPLAFGYDNNYFNLKLEKTLYPLLLKGWNVGILKDSKSVVSGFMGHKIKKKIKNNLIFGVHDVKKGKVIYIADNILFRSFWYNSKVLFGNAIFFVND